MTGWGALASTEDGPLWGSLGGPDNRDGLFVRSLLRGFGVGLLETVPQLYLTTSLFGLAFEQSNTGMKAFQLMSLGLSALSIFKLVFSIFPLLPQGLSDWKRKKQNAFTVLYGKKSYLKKS